METRRCDLLIQGGIVYDGTGAPGKRADVALVDDRVVALGALEDWEAGQRVEVEGLVVAPAFIDIHTHSDLSALHNPDQVSMVYQGVGTQVVANCGIGCGQIDQDSPAFAIEQRWLTPHGVPITWRNLAEHLQRVEETGIALNYIPLCAHGTLRKRIMGFEQRPPTQAEMESMKREVELCLEAGAWGLSTGLEYIPGRYAEPEELIELCRVVKRFGGYYTTHLRSEGDWLIECVLEAIQIAEAAEVPLQLSHHKAEGKQNWGKVQRTLEIVSRAVEGGLDVMLDVYPYTAFQTSMAVAFLPEWALVGEPKESLERLKDPKMRSRLIEEMRQRRPDWEAASIGSTRAHRHLHGRSVAQAAQEAGVSPEEFILDLLLKEDGLVSVANFVLSEEDVRTVMSFPLTMIGSDSVGYRPDGTMGQERPHPRCYGAFPRVLGRYVRDQKLLSLEEAIFKMTGLPAARLKLRDRGVLQPGAYADLVIFDANRMIDHATFTNPHQLSEGVVHLLINGRWVLKEGAMTGNRPGRVLRYGR